MNESLLIAKRKEELDEIMARVNAALAAAEAIHLEKCQKYKAAIKVASDRVAWLKKAIDALKERLDRALLEFKAAGLRLEAATKARQSAEKSLAEAEERLRNAVAARARLREKARAEGEEASGGAGDDSGSVEVADAEALVIACQSVLNVRRDEEAEAKRQEEKWRSAVHILESQLSIHETRHDEAKNVEKYLMERFGFLDATGKQRLREARDRIQEERLARYREILAGKPR